MSWMARAIHYCQKRFCAILFSHKPDSNVPTTLENSIPPPLSSHLLSSEPWQRAIPFWSYRHLISKKKQKKFNSSYSTLISFLDIALPFITILDQTTLLHMKSKVKLIFIWFLVSHQRHAKDRLGWGGGGAMQSKLELVKGCLITTFQS